MITGGDLYTVLTALVPLYVAMMLGYSSVRWWNTFSAVQCSGINRFVAVFAVPLLSFYFISSNDPYKMDGKFILADSISKICILAILAAWARFSRYGSLDWMITLFSLATLPNTLVMGIPLLGAMYGDYYKGVMVQMVVLQSIIWYTLLLFAFELRAARMLLMEQFPDTAASIVAVSVDGDVVSLDGREPLETQAEVGQDGKIKVTIRRSISTSQPYELFLSPRHSMNMDLYTPPRRSTFNHNTQLDLFSMGLTTMPSSKVVTPRPSNLTGAEIYSLSSQTTPPRDISIGFGTEYHLHHHRPVPAAPPAHPARSLAPHPSLSPARQSTCEMYSLQSSHCPTPRASNFHASFNINDLPDHAFHEPSDDHKSGALSVPATTNKPLGYSSCISKMADQSPVDDLKDGPHNHSFNVWSSSTTPSPTVTEAGTAVAAKPANGSKKTTHALHEPDPKAHVLQDFSFGSRTHLMGSPPITAVSSKKFDQKFDQGDIIKSSKFAAYVPQYIHAGGSNTNATIDSNSSNANKGGGFRSNNRMPSSKVMLKLILRMVGRKLIRNPNTYASLIGLTWSLIAFRFGLAMPKIIAESLRILWQAGLGMAMFSLGLFMALQPRLIACGTSLAIFAMAVRFLTGPAVMAATSIVVGMRSIHLHAAIVQASLPQGIVPFVFAREYDLHPDVLSTAVIFGMLVALPVTILYYVLLGI